ncbi:ABC transporter substrate-binding protein [Microlunatus sp. GCM10028923]|uniref:ABC transporter substrate-binding protein n=1 Tax=Microlunatus sp. GCM10028923 TaxID=3273400 RepID=UPI003613EFCB
MVGLDRRAFLGLAGVGAGASLIAGCSPGAAPQQERSADKIVWWDQFLPTQDVEKELFAEFAAAEGGLPVDYAVYDPGKMGQALQLAKQSNQLPDVFTLAGVGAPTSALMEQGWFQPVTLDDKVRSALPAGTLLEGVNVFEGQVYGLPLFGWRMHDSQNWFNTELFTKAGLDPAKPPVGYDEVRAAARAIKQAGAAGWIAPLQFADRIASQIHQLAEAAGSPSVGGIDILTGEYTVGNDHYLAAIDWWLAMQADGVLFEGSASLNARTARGRWAAGSAGMFFDGPYCIGVVAQDFGEFASKVGVAQIPVPEASTQAVINHVPRGSTLWVSKTSKVAEQASKLLSIMVGKEAQIRMLSGMNAPAIYAGTVAEAEVHPTFKQSVELCEKIDFLAPDPVVRNPGVAKVTGAMKSIEPGLGEIVGGVMSGDVPDARAALAKYRDALTAERERAIKQLAGKGVTASPDDWKFPDWQRGQDYTTEPGK